MNILFNQYSQSILKAQNTENPTVSIRSNKENFRDWKPFRGKQRPEFLLYFIPKNETR